MKVVAAASQGGSNLTLIVAILGILGTLAAALVTQWLTGRREERRWQRERQHESDRWARERQERQEQWQREDLARLHGERLKLYGHLIATATRLRTGCRLILPIAFRRPNEDIPDAQVLFAAFNEAKADYLNAQDAVELIASNAIRTTALEFTTWSVVLDNMARFRTEDEGNPPSHIHFSSAHEAMATIEAALESLRRKIRKEIGSDSPDGR